MIFLLKRIGRVGYDEVKGIVVCAQSDSEARGIAAAACGDEGPGAWLHSNFSTCDYVNPQDTGMILVDFRAG